MDNALGIQCLLALQLAANNEMEKQDLHLKRKNKFKSVVGGNLQPAI